MRSGTFVGIAAVRWCGRVAVCIYGAGVAPNTFNMTAVSTTIVHLARSVSYPLGDCFVIICGIGSQGETCAARRAREQKPLHPVPGAGRVAPSVEAAPRGAPA